MKQKPYEGCVSAKPQLLWLVVENRLFNDSLGLTE